MAVENYTVLPNGLRLGSSTAVNQILNESDLSSDSAEAVPTQTSVKSYVDASVAAAGSDGQLTYNNGGTAYGGASALNYDDVNSYLGIGTSDPTYRLDVHGSNPNDATIALVRNTDSTGAAALKIYSSRGSEGTPTARQDGDSLGTVHFGGHDGTNYAIGGIIHTVATELWDGSGHGTEMRFYTTANNSTSNTQVMTITNGARVGIGTTSPSDGLSVTDDGSILSSIGVYRYDSTGTNGGTLRVFGCTGSEGTPGATASGQELGQLRFMGGTGTASYYAGAEITGRATQGWTASARGAELEITTTPDDSTSLTNTFIFDETGRFGVGTDSPVYGMHVSADDDRAGSSIMMQGFTGTGGGGPILAFRSARGSESTPAEPDSGHNLAYIAATGYDGSTYKSGGLITCVAEQDWSSTALGSAWYFYVCENNTTTTDWKMRIRQDGSVWMPDVYGDLISSNPRDLEIDDNGQLGYVSSARKYKKYIKTLNDVRFLDDLRPVTFKFKKDKNNTCQYGLIAEEVEEVAKDFVFYNENFEIEGVHYKKFIPVLIKANQDLKKKLAKVEEKLEKLSAKKKKTVKK